MIVVIGGVETTVKIKMMPKKPKEVELAEKQKEERGAMLPEKETSVGGLDATGFEAYFRKQQLAQQQDDYWSEVGMASGAFGGYSAFSDTDDCDINVTNAGCGYNVARNVGAGRPEGAGDVVFLSAMGSDALALAADCELGNAGVDTSRVKRLAGSTSVRIEMHNMMGDLQFLRKDDSAMTAITPEYIDENDDIINSADVIFMDGSLPLETIKHIADKYSSKKVYFDPGSISGAAKFADAECSVYGVMPGRRESEVMTGLQVLGLDQLMEAGLKLEGDGVTQTVITLKGGGLYYKEGVDGGIVKPANVLSFADTSGAGDVVSAAIISSIADGKSLKDAAEAAIAAADDFLSDANDESIYQQLKNKGIYVE